MTHRVRLVVVPTERRVIETEHDDRRMALLLALGQVPLGYTVTDVDVLPEHGDTESDPAEPGRR
ncbi:hypothetical protein K0028_07435 [Curtobacterium flaccumfaciens pv. flaccumfaciens]|uniref:hypothetical protein n=1 Tax=Curtobacterium flaccumfaciens TaxID=2035 RepID=UPI0021B09D00|nr:hypothetical protein [Curtobacterium flaccumfaciens]QYI98716.1 hypothetical protein K0028_07435 [Curtobacterium flaccumfaciens pv. flaccumfaciens]